MKRLFMISRCWLRVRTPVGVAGRAGSSLRNRPKMKLRTQQHINVGAEYPPRGPPTELFSGLMRSLTSYCEPSMACMNRRLHSSTEDALPCTLHFVHGAHRALQVCSSSCARHDPIATSCSQGD